MRTTSADDIFSDLRGIPFVAQVSGGPVPLPGANGSMKEHLFVNLTYDDHGHAASGADLLQRLRTIALCVIEKLGKGGQRLPYPTICVSVFDIPREGENVRMYRTRFNVSDLPRASPSLFAEVVVGEDSQLKEIMELLSS